MNLKIALISATALGLLMATGAVYAGDNDAALLYEQGNGNSATTDQSNAHDSSIGAAGLAARQIGGGNTLTITQVGGGNTAGTTGVIGIDQENNDNYIYAYQGYGNDPSWVPPTANNITSIKQSGYTGASSPNTAGHANEATVYQFYSDNVGAITQHYSGTGAPNSIYVNETGGAGSTGNNINSISQDGHNNSVNMTLTNLSGGGKNGDGSFTNNGIASVVANPASYTQITTPWNIGQATVTQAGSGNTLGFNISGNDNKFGFYQSGTSGTRQVSGGITGGNFDEIAAAQEGVSDLLNVNMSGYANQLGSIQFGGSDNTGTASISGQSNRALLLQGGTGGSNTGEVDTGATSGGSGGNNLGVIQYATGGSNHGTVNVQSGSSNTAVLGQYASGGSNTAGVTINGSGNNLLSGVTPSSFTGVAAANAPAASVTIGEVASVLGGNLNTLLGANIGPALSGQHLLTPGLMTQFAYGGGTNSLTVNVSSSNNLFSTAQGTLSSGANTLVATIEGGDDNQLSAAQLSYGGGNNSATTVQNGSHNSIGLTQIGTNTANITQ